jgi:hypothetical protein
MGHHHHQNCGQSARLTVESQEEKTTVNLQLDLEPCPRHAEAQHQGRPRQHAGPSRLRRHAARAQAREKAAAEAASYADVPARATISPTSPIATAAEAVAEEAVAVATKDTNENNSNTAQVTVAEEHATTEELAASSSIGVSERFIKVIKIRDDTIEEL